MNKKTWIIFGILAIATVVGLIYAGSKNQLDVDDIKRDQIVSANERNGNIEDHIKGSKEAKVLIFEYADFQCPACAEASNLTSKLVDKYEGKVALIYRHFPLPGHNNAKAAAAAAEAAGKQGKFWEMNKALYSNQFAWTNETTNRDQLFADYANEIGLDMDKYNADIKSDQIAQKIKFDMALAKLENINETPTFIIDGKKISSDVWADQTELYKLIDSKLK